MHCLAAGFNVMMRKADSNATEFQLYWMINVTCEGSDVAIDGETYFWRPSMYLESMRFPHRSWKQLEGQHYLSKADDDDPPAICGLNEHDDLEKSDIHFVSRHGVQFDVDWKFVWSSKNGRLRTMVTFTEVTVWLDEVKDEVIARRRLEQDLDLSSFSEPEVVPHPLTGPRFKFRPIP